jgi:putative tricarboxylic transport membrane protein
MDRFESMGGTLYTAPGLVPGILGLALVLLGLLLTWRARRNTSSGDPGSAGGPTLPLLSTRTLVTLALMLVYAAGLVSRLPFWLSTGMFVALFIGWFSGDQAPQRSWRQRIILALSCAVATSIIVTLVFERVFLVRLP